MHAFIVYGPDNDSYAFRGYPTQSDSQKSHQHLVPDMSGANQRRGRRCETCGELLSKWDEPLAGLIIKKRTYDISNTYDGVVVVSPRFMSAYEENKLFGLVFRRLPDDPDFFAIQASRTVEFDSDRRKTRFIRPCPSCGRYESVVGATPGCLRSGSEVEGPEFVRTDLEFGTSDEKQPLLLCGEVVANVLSHAKLKGLDLISIEES